MTLPCGTPLLTSLQLDDTPLMQTLCFLSVRKALIQVSTCPPMPAAWSLESKCGWGTVSNALEQSRYTVSILSLSSSALCSSYWYSNNWVRQDMPERNPCWFLLSKPECSRWSIMCLRIILSSTLHAEDVRLIGL